LHLKALGPIWATNDFKTLSTMRVRKSGSCPLIWVARSFLISGGLPLGQRAPQRQAYRLTELERFSKWLGAPLHLKPTFFPVSGDDAAKLIIAVDMTAGADDAMRISGAVLSAVWAQQRNIADEKTLAELLKENDLPASCLEAIAQPSRSNSIRKVHSNGNRRGCLWRAKLCLEGRNFLGSRSTRFC
jgi:2-hydroxychromene-2-carboxylate isomerase